MHLDQLSGIISEDIEKKRPYLAKKLKDLYPHLFDNDIHPVIDWMAVADPVSFESDGRKTPFVNTIFDWYTNNKIRLPEDIETVRDVLAKYNDLYHHGKLKKKVDEYKSPGDLRADIDEVSGVVDENIYGDYLELIDEIPGFKMYEITNYADGREAFKDSGWCVQHQDMFNEYKPPYFMVVTDKNKRYALLHESSNQAKDVYDNPLTLELAKPIKKFILEIWSEFDTNDKYSDLWNFVEFWPGIVEKIMKEPDRAVDFAKYVIKGRWSEVEPIIMQNPGYAYVYVRDVIKGRWPEAEPFIMKNASIAYEYAKNFIKGRWPEAEPFIMKDPWYAYHYALFIIKDRWPEAEPYIVKDDYAAYHYAVRVLKRRWPEAEPVILKKIPGSRDYYSSYASPYKEIYKIRD